MAGGSSFGRSFIGTWAAILIGTGACACSSDGGSDGASNGGGSGGGGGSTGGSPNPDGAAGGSGGAVDATPLPGGVTADAGPVGGGATPDAAGPSPDAGPPGPAACADSDLPKQPFIFPDGPDNPGGPPADAFGPLRHQLARDFGVTLLDGTQWRLSQHWTGCETYVFLTDALPQSDTNGSPAWARDIDDLLRRSPPNVNYVFVSRSASDEGARTSVQTVADQIETVLAASSPEEATAWRRRLVLVGEAANNITGWVKSALRGHGVRGLVIDRFQRIQGMGSFADVVRYDQAAADAGGWPWTNNIAYAAYEARRHNFLANRAARMSAESVTAVPLFQGEVLAGFQDVTIDLPSAEVLAGFDTLEVEVEMRCPNDTALEAGNCGAWDYLAWLWLAETVDGVESRREVARFITTYHREAHWVVDATPMLALPGFKAGGTQTFRWEFAPEWNTQPTATWLNLRFSNRGKGHRPDALVPIAAGGAFNAAYNDGREPVTADVPGDAKKVDLYAVITGHGADGRTSCAEFCNHGHAFTVNGRTHTKDHPEAQVPDGCVDRVDQGMTPNQWGTWWFGRGGWCPGMQVEPFVVDVTADAPAGGPVTASYRGLYNGRDPQDGEGNIQMSSYLVIYR
ncbi:hypothetical protein L6V77_29985 [Myxococcota bacterium]|nr:hypothetical protein [Myxococcota bacterium]